MLMRLSIPFALGVVVLTSTSYAGGPPVPAVEYSADRVIETEAGIFTGKVYSARGKERSETRTTVTLTHPQIGSQDAKLFEVPADYSAMPSMGAMGRLGGLGNAAKGMFSRVPGAGR